MSWHTRTRLIWNTLRNHKLLIVCLLNRRLLYLINFRLYLLCLYWWFNIRNLFLPINWYFLKSWNVILIHIYVRIYWQFSFFINWYWWWLYSILLVQFNMNILFIIILFFLWNFDRYIFILLCLWFILSLHNNINFYNKIFKKNIN